MSDEAKIKITLDDLDGSGALVQGSPAAAAVAQGQAGRTYGNVSDLQTTRLEIGTEVAEKLYMKGWFYLGVAGLLGAFAAWAICEPSFEDGDSSGAWGNFWLIPLAVVLMCFGFAVAESIVEQSPRKALYRGALALVVGVVLGFLFDAVANVVFTITTGLAAAAGIAEVDNPAFWLARAIAWTVLGTAAGLSYGLIGGSFKRGQYGILGGVIGAAVGGLVFDPISLALEGAEVSRAVGFSLFGASTGIAMGWVESALKDRWLLVISGPLSGKQFILYKPITSAGSLQTCDIYLFKDPDIQPLHLEFGLRGATTWLRPIGAVDVGGVTARERRLNHGDVVAVGRYRFLYQERARD